MVIKLGSKSIQMQVSRNSNSNQYLNNVSITMSLPSVYNTNTKKGGRKRDNPTKSSSTSTKNNAPSPYLPTHDIQTEEPSTMKQQKTNQKEEDYPREIPQTRLDQLLNTLGRALESESTLNCSKWVVRSDTNESELLSMSNVTPPFAPQTYAPGVFNNVVSRSLASNEKRPPVPPATDYLYQAAVDLPQQGGPSLESTIEKDFQRRMKQLEQRHLVYTSRLSDRMTNLKSIGSNFDESTDSCISRSTLSHLLYERKCRVQSSVANRRLQELLFECLGEIEKACKRSTLLAETLCENVVVQKNQVANSTLWKEFLMRAEEDAQQQLNLASMDQKHYSDTFDRCADECKEALTSSKYVPEEAIINVKRIVCVRPGHMLPQSRRRSRDTRRRVSRLHHNNSEVAILLAALNKEYARLDGTGGKSVSITKKISKVRSSSKDSKDSKTNNNEEEESSSNEAKEMHHTTTSSSKDLTLLRHGGQGGRVPLFPAVVQLSTSVIKWLLPATGCSINSIVYFCLEERAGRWKSHSGSNKGSSLSQSTKSKDGTLSGATYSRVQHAMCNVLFDIYEGRGTSERGMADNGSNGRSTNMQVLETCADHRDNPVSKVLDASSLLFDEKLLVQQFLGSYPDVICARVGSEILHFASASVLQIFETSMCRDICNTLDRDATSKIQATYPENAAMRNADLKLYHLDGEKQTFFHKSSPLIGSKMLRLDTVAMRELCAMYGVSGQVGAGKASSVYSNSNSSNTSSSGLDPLPDSMSIFTSDRKESTQNTQNSTTTTNDNDSELSYFVLHNPTTRAVQTFLDKLKVRSKAERLARKKDCYGGLVEKERVAAVEWSRNKPIPGQNRRNSKKDKEEDEATGSTVPCIALLVGVELPHRHRTKSTREKTRTDVDEKKTNPNGDVATGAAAGGATGATGATAATNVIKKRRSSSGSGDSIISGLAVGSFCRWRGCLCKGTKIPVLSSGKQSKHALCGLHSILRSFLEGCGAKEELARHLPSNKNMKAVLAKNKTTTEIAVEFLRITATSALLQELLGGKLAATIRAFCRRAAADAKAQPSTKRNSPNRDKSSNNTTTNAENEQAMKENDKQRKDLDKDVSLSQQVYATESDVAEELRKLCSLGVFPKAELQTIRETYNELDRERIRLLATKNDRDRKDRNTTGEGEEYEPSSRDAAAATQNIRTEGELELEFCKRKLAILRGRRQELELNLSKGIDIMNNNKINTNASNDSGSSLELLSRQQQKQSQQQSQPMTSTPSSSTSNLVAHEHMSPTERAIVNAAAREVEKVASEHEAQQKSLARARLSDARKFSEQNYGKKSSVEELKQKQTTAARRGKQKKKSTGSVYLSKFFFESCFFCLFDSIFIVHLFSFLTTDNSICIFLFF